MLYKTNNDVLHSCDGTYIFIRRKMKCSLQLGFASLNRTFNLSLLENICTIALIIIHYVYNISHKRLVLLLSDCVNAFDTCTFKRIFKNEDELYNISEIEYETHF